MKEKYSSGTDRQGSLSSKKTPPVQYVGFFGSWDAPKYRFYLTFIRICMASVFLGLLYANVRMIQDNFLWSFILEDEFSLIIMIVIEGMVLLTLGLLASVSYKFYRHLKREEAEAQGAADRLNVHVNHMHLNFRKIKTELWSQLISIENKLVNSATVSTPYKTDGTSALRFNDDQYLIWKHLTNLERVFSCSYSIDQDTEVDGYTSSKILSYRPLVNSFDQLELGIKQLLKSGTDIHHEATVSDMICHRLITLDEVNRMALNSINNTEYLLNYVIPKIDSLSDLEGYSSSLKADIESNLSVRTLTADESILQKLCIRGIDTIGSLTHCAYSDIEEWLGVVDAKLLESSLIRMNPRFRFLRAQDRCYDEPLFSDMDLDSLLGDDPDEQKS